MFGYTATFLRDFFGSTHKTYTAMVIAFGDLYAGTYEEHSYLFVQNKNGIYSKTEESLANNPALMVAVIVSLVLATFVGITGTVAFVMVSHYRVFLVVVYRFAPPQVGQTFLEKYIREQMLKANFSNLEQMLEDSNYGSAQNKTNALMAKSKKKTEQAKDEQLNQATKEKSELPHPFEFPEIAITSLRRSYTDSLFEFLSKETELRPDISEYQIKMSELQNLRDVRRRTGKGGISEKEFNAQAPPLPPAKIINLRKLKERYEKFCFSHGYTQQALSSAKAETTFHKFDMTYVAECNGTTEVYKKIRWKTKKEKLEAAQAKHAEPEENVSLLPFCRSECMFTLFDVDFIPTTEFQERYIKYCNSNGVMPEPVTKRAMGDMGAGFERQSQTNVSSHARQMKPEKEEVLTPDQQLAMMVEVITRLRPTPLKERIDQRSKGWVEKSKQNSLCLFMKENYYTQWTSEKDIIQVQS